MPDFWEKMTIPDDWTPTPDNVNDLPGPLRKYIHNIETSCDPAGTMRDNYLFERENDLLRQECIKLSDGSKIQSFMMIAELIVILLLIVLMSWN